MYVGDSAAQNAKYRGVLSNQLEWGALVKDAGSFKLSSSISEAQRDTLTRIQFKTAAYLRRLAQPLRCFV